MNRVLGTRVWPLAAACPRAVLLADLHLPAEGGPALAWLQAALDAARDEGAAVFVLGDLFDSYVSRSQVRHGVWRDAAAAFAAARAAGVPIHLLHGNRDFLLGAEFAAASGVMPVAGGLRGSIGGVDTLLLHGDELCVADVPYQRAKRWLRHPLTRAFARSLPLGLALRVAARARRRSGMVIRSGDQTRFLPPLAAVDEALASGATRLVFGHIHRFVHVVRPAGECWVVPAFDATALALRCRDGRCEPFVLRPGGAVPDLEPCPFPP